MVFSHQVVSYSLRPHGLQDARLPYPSPSPGVCQSSCPLNRRCHPTISPSVASFPLVLNLSWHQVFSNESAPLIRWPKYWASASAAVLPMKIQGWFPLGLTGLISLQSKGLSRVFSSTTVPTHQFLSTAFFMDQLSYPYMTTGKTIALTIWTFVNKAMSLLFDN